MSNEDYARGYNDGFRAGVEAGKELKAPSYPTWPTPKGCSVCGMVFEVGKAYGYVCGNSNCPSKVTCTLDSDTTYYTPNTNWSSWMSGRPTTKIT